MTTFKMKDVSCFLTRFEQTKQYFIRVAAGKSSHID